MFMCECTKEEARYAATVWVTCRMYYLRGLQYCLSVHDIYPHPLGLLHRRGLPYDHPGANGLTLQYMDK